MKIKLKIEPGLAPLLRLMAEEAGVTIEKMVQICIGSVVAGWVQDRLNGQGVLDSSGTYPLLPGDGDSTGY